MKRLALFPVVASLPVILCLTGCLTSAEDIVTDRDTASDPLGDIVALGGYLFATNHDRSGHGGSQVDLFKFAADGFPEGRFDLGLNGAGYLAACSDGQSIYLQKRGSGHLFKTSPIGEVAWTRVDPHSGSNLLACGIAYRADVDSFVVAYHEPGTSTYVTVHYGPGFDGAAGPARTQELSLFDPATGILAVAWHDGYLWALGRTAEGSAVVQGISIEGVFATRFFDLEDPTACGLTVVGDDLMIAYQDRRFESLVIADPVAP